MKYTTLLENIKNPVFSLQELKLMGYKVIHSQLSSLAKKGQIVKLKNGLYLLENKKELAIPENIALRLYEPSYISLEWALQTYNLIPEIVYNTTSITTKATRKFKNVFGLFIYKKIKNNLFWGYKKEEKNGQSYLIAEPEKALLDYLYFNLSKIKNEDDLAEIRLDSESLKSLNWKKLDEYLKMFNNKRIDQIINRIKCSLSIK
jgi:predicted transcriptional regulator of viral defense system